MNKWLLLILLFIAGILWFIHKDLQRLAVAQYAQVAGIQCGFQKLGQINLDTGEITCKNK